MDPMSGITAKKVEHCSGLLRLRVFFEGFIEIVKRLQCMMTVPFMFWMFYF